MAKMVEKRLASERRASHGRRSGKRPFGCSGTIRLRSSACRSWKTDGTLVAIPIYCANTEKIVVFRHALQCVASNLSDPARIRPKRGGCVAPDDFIAGKIWFFVRAPSKIRVVG